MGRDPFGLVVGLPPMSVWITQAQEVRTPTLGGNAGAQVGSRLAE